MTYKALVPAAALLLVGVLASVSMADQQAQRRDAKPAAPAATATMRGAPAGPLPRCPEVGYEPPLPMPVVRQVYEFAARHPEVLQYVPCYCGCERVGHKANHDCFVKTRGADGRVTQWDSHGMGCEVCLGVGRRA